MKFLKRFKKKVLENLDYVLTIARPINKFQNCIQLKFLYNGKKRWFKTEDIPSSTFICEDWCDIWINKEELRKKRL